MKFTASIVAFALATASTVSAGTIYSPTKGQVLSSGSTFNFTFDGLRYFKESTNSVSVLLSPPGSWSGGSGSQGVTLIEDLKPTGLSSVFYTDISPTFFYESSPSSVSGDWTLVVLEKYNAYGGNAATALWTQTVTFSN